MVVRVDIDGTIATLAGDGDYAKAEPIHENIRVVNALKRAGHTVVMWTARGTVTGIDWKDVTVRQLRAWGVEFDGLEFGKPAFDMLIDDRAICADCFFGRVQECKSSQSPKL
jgi:dTDP-glucose 4,6-dehydratase